MPTVADQAIVIRQWDWSETSQTVSLFCRELGVLRGVAKGAKREKGAFSGGLDLLTLGQIVAITKPNRDLATFTEWDLQEVFPALRANLRCHYAGLYFADIVHHVVRDSDPHPALWEALLRNLRSLDPAVDPARRLLDFQWCALVEAGYRPDLTLPDAADPTPRAFGFDPEDGRLTPDPGPGAAASVWRVRAGSVDLLRRLGDPAPAGADAADADTVDRCNRLLAAYLAWVIGRPLDAARPLFGAPEPR